MQQRFPWIAQQNWEDILFIHTPVPAPVLQEYVPAPFTIDTYNGQGWLTLVLFRATNSRFRYFPSFLSYPKLNQMNLRTYVTFGGESGVYFFSIHINSLLATLGGNFAALPFQQAPLLIREKNNSVHITGHRLFAENLGRLQLSYQPDACSFKPEKESLSYFLTERYKIFTKRSNQIRKGTIYHNKWLLEKVNLSVEDCQHVPFSITSSAFSHYSAKQTTFLYPFEKVGIFNEPSFP